MSEITIDIPCPDNALPIVRDAWKRRRRVTMPQAETEPAMTISFYGRPFHVFAVNGALYSPVRQAFAAERSVAADFSRFLTSVSGYLSEERTARLLATPEKVFAVVNDIACEAVSEPHWCMSFHNAHRGDRPSQIRCNLSLHRDFPENIAPSEAPCIAFRADRKADLEACMARLHELHPRSSLFPTGDQCTVYRPEILKADTLTMSIRAVARSLVGATHKALPALPRAAVESWMELRRMSVSGREDAIGFARVAASIASLLRLSSESSDEEVEKWRRRALAQADMLDVRLATEPDLVHAAEEDFLDTYGPQP